MSTKHEEAEASSSNKSKLLLNGNSVHGPLGNGDSLHDSLENGEGFFDGQKSKEITKPRRKNYYGSGFISLMLVTMMMYLQSKDNVNMGAPKGVFSRLKLLNDSPDEELGAPLAQRWNHSSQSFEPNVSDWDEKREAWRFKHSTLRLLEGDRPRVLIITGITPEPCEPALLHLALRSAKSKLDYCTKHGMQLFFHAYADREFDYNWAKLPVIRSLMLRHPEVEWIWWLDSDAVLTDMSFELPFAELKNHNLVLNGDDGLVYEKRDVVGLSTGVLLIRNCQWSLDLLDKWAYDGRAGGHAKRSQNEKLVGVNYHSSLISLLAQDKGNPADQQRWAPMVKLVKRSVIGKSKRAVAQGFGGFSSVAHFPGCLSSCRGNSGQQTQNKKIDACTKQLKHALDFADKQVYEQFGFEQRTVANVVFYSTNETHDSNIKDSETFRILPTITDWDQKRQAYIAQNNGSATWNNQVLLAGGTSAYPCTSVEGAHLLLKGFKNWVDYGRMQGFKGFYNMALIDRGLIGGWSKILVSRLLMVKHPEVEWIWWSDTDAVFTSMNSPVPFERYDAKGYNLIMWGDQHEVFELNKYNGISTGNFLIRNCQWSLDLLDKWASFGATKERREKNGKWMTQYLKGPPGWSVDDQSALVYLLVTERAKWMSKVHFEQNIVMSGDWMHWTRLFMDEFELSQQDRPLVTHFAGCKLCAEVISDRGNCVSAMNKTLNFADNEVLALYGFRHEQLNSSIVTGSVRGDIPERTAAEIERYVRKETTATVVLTNNQISTTRADIQNDGNVGKHEEELTTAVEDLEEAEADLELVETDDDLAVAQKEVASARAKLAAIMNRKPKDQMEDTKEVTKAKQPESTLDIEETVDSEDVADAEQTLDREDTAEVERPEKTLDREEALDSKDTAKAEKTLNPKEVLDREDTAGEETLDSKDAAEAEKTLNRKEVLDSEDTAEVEKTLNRERTLDREETLDGKDIEEEGRTLDREVTAEAKKTLHRKETPDSDDIAEVAQPEQTLDREETLDSEDIAKAEKTLDSEDTAEAERTFSREETLDSENIAEAELPERTLDIGEPLHSKVVEKTKKSEEVIDTDEFLDREDIAEAQQPPKAERSGKTLDREETLDSEDIEVAGQPEKILGREETLDSENIAEREETINRKEALDSEDTAEAIKTLNREETLNSKEIEKTREPLDSAETFSREEAEEAELFKRTLEMQEALRKVKN